MPARQELHGRRVRTPAAAVILEHPHNPSRISRRGFSWRWALAGWLALAGSSGLWAQPSKELSAQAVAEQLQAQKETIAHEVAATLKTNALRTSYTTVWRDFEDAAIDALCDILPKRIGGLTQQQLDRGKAGREKNRLADLVVACGTNQIEISIKAARRSANPENDLGTFHDHPARQRIFADSFTLWIRYDDAGKEIKLDRIYFDRTWRFVGKSSLVDGVKYRKKDGNMRPKPWAMFDSGEAYWRTEAEFEAAVKRAETFRANELITEHLRDLSEADQRLLYERLREKFGAPPAAER